MIVTLLPSDRGRWACSSGESSLVSKRHALCFACWSAYGEIGMIVTASGTPSL
ncbi:hypothetical protein [Saccharibacter floricola]|uniref:hypothetical protein n=1 Tax=Saccharibacter floricola TaxID=231053 RepID=UPI00222EFF96|nr:hypothetical protein [Saccharibacter floricola]